MRKKKIMKNILLFSTAMFLLLVAFNCSSPTAPQTGLTLAVADVSCTEAWLNLNTGSLPLPANIVVNKNSIAFLSFTLTSSDTTLYDSTLFPNQTYTYRAVYGSSKGETVTAKTLDTTSSNFTWQTFTFGDPGAGNSILNDVTIINDTLAYAVGAIYVNDSTGKPDPNAYNLAKWNGHSWQMLQVQFYTVRGSSHRTPYPASSILAYSDSVIWISMAGDQVVKYSGTQEETMFLPNSYSIKKLWGENSSSIYAVGDNGNIEFYSKSNWQKIESGTDVKLLDIFGTPDGKNVWISGYQDNKPTVLLQYSDNQLTTIINDQNHLLSNYPGIISGGIESIWTNSPNNLFLLTWYGLYRVENNNFPNPKNLWTGDPNTWALIKVRGNNTNDIIAAGIDGRIWHYNGLHWKFYSELANNSDTYYSIAIKGNICIAVGERYENGIVDYGLIQIGRR